jgi:Mrp family chromosome partitioning ATPase
MQAFIKQVSEEFDIVLYDSPPVLPVTDAVVLASQVDAVFLVYQMGRAGRGLLKRAKSHLEAVQPDLRGVVLNDIKAEVSDFSPAEYYYQYYSRHADEKASHPLSRLEKAVAGVRHRLGHRASDSKRRGGSGPDKTRTPARTAGGSEYEDVLGITDEK